MSKVIFLDRDGTINVDHGYVYKIEDWKFVDGAIGALRKLQAAGYKLAIVTNQSGIGRGYYTLKDMYKLHGHMEALLRKEDISIDVIAFCAHAPEENCSCRKPNPDMIKQIEEKIDDIDYANSWIVGDKEADVGWGKNVGVKTALLRSEYWEEGKLKKKPDLIADSLFEATEKIISL